MAKRTNKKTSTTSRKMAPPATPAKPAATWWIPVGVAVDTGLEPITGHHSETNAAVRELYDRLDSIIRGALANAGIPCTDLSLARAYIGGQTGLERPWFPPATPATPAPPASKRELPELDGPLSGYRLPELRELADELGLDSSGKKSDLVERIGALYE